MKKILSIAAFAVAFCAGLQAQQSIVLPDLLQGEIVLQQQTDARIWGEAAPGAQITVNTSWNGRDYRVKAGADSLWSVKVSTPEASYTPYDIKIASGREQVVLQDVLIGDVWVCGGQSNMAMPVKGMFNCTVDDAAGTILHSAKNKGLRYVTVEQHQATESEPGYFTKGTWHRSGPATAGDFSATGVRHMDMRCRMRGTPAENNAQQPDIGAERM